MSELAMEVSKKTGIPEDDAVMFLGILARSGLTGRDGATSLIAALNTPNGTAYGADGIRAAAILNKWSGS